MSSLKAALLVLSAGVAATVVIGAIALLSSNSGGGFFPGLGAAFAIVLVGIGNVLVLLFNGIYWLRFGAPTWLRVMVAIQILPALGCVWMIGQHLYTHF